MNELIDYLQEALTEKADPEKAEGMAAYLKTEMPFYGVQKPEQKMLYRKLKPMLKELVQTEQDYRDVVLQLWQLPHREEKYTAIFVARHCKAWIQPSCLDLYEQLLREGAWWDFVDEICINLVGQLHRNHRDEIQPIMDQWIQDPDFWIRRSAILCQLKHKDQTDTEVLFRYCLTCMDETEFFIRKAIGWALREYSKIAPDTVASFLTEHKAKLSGLSYREGAKVLKKHGWDL